MRLTKLLQNLEIPLDDGDYAADFGSGPLTFVCALWIAKPELRKKRVTWYCVDISNKALSFGEDLFLALCAYTGKKNNNGEIPWTVKKVCGAFGTPLSEKVSLVTEANMFNEIFWNSPLSLDDQAEKTHRTVMHYLKQAGSVLFIGDTACRRAFKPVEDGIFSGRFFYICAVSPCRSLLFPQSSAPRRNKNADSVS